MTKVNWTKEECIHFYNDAREIVKYDYIPWAKVIVKALKDAKAPIIADVGCGPGILDFELIKHLPEAKFILMDNADEMLTIVETKNGGRYPMDIIKAGAEKLPLEDKSVDVVICKHLLTHVENPMTVLEEIQRVLKTEGKAFIIDFDSSAWKLVAWVLYNLIKLKFDEKRANRFWYGYKNGYPSSKLMNILSEMAFRIDDFHMKGVNYIITASKMI